MDRLLGFFVLLERCANCVVLAVGLVGLAGGGRIGLKTSTAPPRDWQVARSAARWRDVTSLYEGALRSS